jgi:hypothetical protein
VGTGSQATIGPVEGQVAPRPVLVHEANDMAVDGDLVPAMDWLSPRLHLGLRELLQPGQIAVRADASRECYGDMESWRGSGDQTSFSRRSRQRSKTWAVTSGRRHSARV